MMRHSHRHERTTASTTALFEKHFGRRSIPFSVFPTACLAVSGEGETIHVLVVIGSILYVILIRFAYVCLLQVVLLWTRSAVRSSETQLCPDSDT